MTNETKTQSKAKKIADIVINVLIWIFVVFSALITVMVFVAQGSGGGVPALFGKSFITIESESMEPVYDKGDLVFVNRISEEEAKDLPTGTIVTYYAPIDINGDGVSRDINTHEIIGRTEDGAYITKGRGNEEPDGYNIRYGDIIGTCTEGGKVGGIGSVIGFLRSSLGFFLCIVLPLILFFLYELYRFIALLVSEKAKKESAAMSKEAEEEIKRRAIEEYLANQGKAETDEAEECTDKPADAE